MKRTGKKSILILGLLRLVLFPEPLVAQDKNFYFFDAGHLKSTIRHELGLTVGAHWAKSDMITTYTSVDNGVAYPEPVFNRAISLLSLSYEPRIRLIEYRSASSISLDFPLTGSFSLVDILSGSRVKYSAEPLTNAEIQSGVFSKQRAHMLGGLHLELGALLSFNTGQGATLENTRKLGLTLSSGFIYLYGPLIFNVLEEYERSDYKGLLSWVTPVGRVGLHFNRFILYYTFGVHPTRVYYQSANTLGVQSSMLNTYNKITLAVRLGD